MALWIRFLLGLPARQEDIKELNEALPELFHQETFSPHRKRRHIPWWFLDLSDEDLVAELKRWIKEAQIESPKPVSSVRCPKLDCPLRNSQSLSSTDDEGPILAYLYAGGGPDTKPPKDMFLDLVRKSRKGMSLIKEVILTDPYIYSDMSEDGVEGGFDNLVAYLGALGLDADSSFTLNKTPSPKNASEESKKLLDQKLRKHYPNVTLRNYSPKCSFHDRLYIVRDNKGELRGVFGPSLNGLNSNAIVLMGDIEGMQLTKKLSQWL